MENKQTAVEWLYDEIKHIIPNDFLIKFKEAKAMEKEHIKDAYKSGVAWGYNNMDEYYYNETYGTPVDKK